ncbi:HtaA domain-containing protein [Streptomyces hesseae]|uniref:HtaA domain-containing protein n=1 Tax=Streptomyces hesseae TaxID=3075519 RepID=A0ABU2SVM8_9ACTN|nr:HtaA domain-containing protein [Streptomyces sp. DSM 40473]MDT0452060.1 HtaA domain-containing protein [Streptomyces sp. DSM 40473]
MLPSRPARAPVVALLAALLTAATALVPAAHAADGPGSSGTREVSGGRLDWGIKSSFQSYVTGPIAQGSWELRGGAATIGGSRFRFHSAKGSYTPESGALEAAFSGGVHFTGHRKPDGTHELDLTITRPTVRLTGGAGSLYTATLYADMTSRAKGTGEVTTAAQVPLAALDVSGVDLRGGGTHVGLADVPATLTAQGAKAFAGYYTQGTALDPVTLSADILAAAAQASPGAGPSTAPSAAPSNASGEKRATEGGFTEAAVDWGVRRTFREYVTGSIAQGSWKLGDGAQDGGALFRFPRGKGTYDAGAGSLDAAFAGTLRFTGNHLDLTLGGVKVAVKEGRGTLSADVTGDGRTAAEGVPLVTFDASGLKEKDGLAAVAEAPAKLTAEGAKAFGGMYQEGTDMDPVSLAVPLDAKAALPPLPDLGSGSSAAPSAAAEPRTKSTASSSSSSSGSASFPAVPVAVTAAVVVAAAVATFLMTRRRTPTASTPSLD